MSNMNYGFDEEQENAIRYAGLLLRAQVIKSAVSLDSMKKRLRKAGGESTSAEIQDRIVALEEQIELKRKHSYTLLAMVVTDNE